MNPITVLHIPHSSTFIPEEERRNILLSDKSLALELLKMTDWYTNELFTSGNGECGVVLYPVSRLLLDPERFADDELEIMASRGMGVIYTKTSEGQPLRYEMDSDVREGLLKKYYYPHHAQLSQMVSSILSKSGKALIVDCHSFPSSPLPYEIDQNKDRPGVCIGTDPFHTPDGISEFAKAKFNERGFVVEMNRPFSGALVPIEYFQKETAVTGIMIEINRRLYMDEKTGIRLSKFESVKRAVGSVVSELNQYYRSYDPTSRSSGRAEARR